MQRNRYWSVVAWLVLAVTGAAYAQKVGDISCDPKNPTNCSRWNGTKWVKISCCGKKKGRDGYSLKDGGYSNFGEKQGRQRGPLPTDSTSGKTQDGTTEDGLASESLTEANRTLTEDLKERDELVKELDELVKEFEKSCNEAIEANNRRLEELEEALQLGQEELEKDKKRYASWWWWLP